MLKAAKGRVRCGRCAHVFDALTFLIDVQENDGEVSAQPPEQPASTAPPAPVERASNRPLEPREQSTEIPYDPDRFEVGEIPDSALEFTADDLSKVFVTGPARPLPAGPSKTGEWTSLDPASDDDTAEHEILDIEVEASPSGEYITLEGDSVVLTDDDPSVTPESFGEFLGSEPTQKSGTSDEPASKAARSTAAIDDEVQREIEAAFAADPTTRAEFTLPSGKRVEIGRPVEATLSASDAADDAAEALDTARTQERRRVVTWSIASGVLALLLCVQLVHHNRQSLVRSAVIGPALGSIYATLGSELSPQWNVQAYELRQFGAAAESGAGGTLRVRASLLNGALHAQPYPVLRLTLQDRFGDQVGLRDVEPREYLRSEPARNAMIGAGQRIDADIAIVDPGKDAVGFEIDVCLKAPPDRLTCANDAVRNVT